MLSEKTVTERFSELRTDARLLNQNLTKLRAFLAENDASANVITDLFARLGASRSIYSAVAGDADLVTRAQAEYGGQVSLASIAKGIEVAIDATLAGIIAAFPSQGGYIMKDRLNVDGSITVRAFTPAETSGLRDLLQTLENAVS